MRAAHKRRILAELGVDVYVRRDAGSVRAAEERAFDAAPPSQADEPLASVPQGIADGVEWDPLRAMVAACTRCVLHAGRTQTVFGVGRRDARWMIIGEAPGAEEDRRGEPFVGRAGQLLDSMLRALGLRREQVYIANVLKCRPPGNRDPRPEESRELPPVPGPSDRARGADAHHRRGPHRGADPARDRSADRQAARPGALARRARLAGDRHLSPGVPAAQPGREAQGLAGPAAREPDLPRARARAWCAA